MRYIFREVQRERRLTAAAHRLEAAERALCKSLPEQEPVMHLVVEATNAGSLQRHFWSVVPQLPVGALVRQVSAQPVKDRAAGNGQSTIIEWQNKDTH